MTREEAIDVLKANYPDSRYELLREAVDVAIEALKVIKPEKEDIGFEEDEIFLLSKEEYEKYKDKIPVINYRWWLRSPGSTFISAVYVNCYGKSCSGYIGDKYVAVRPALKLKREYDIGVRVVLNDFPWIVIDKNLAIAEVPIGQTAFDTDDSNDHCYRNSYIRAYLKKWFEDRDETSEELRADVVEAKRGIWFPRDGKYKCSECGSIADKHTPFCPNCGADMRGEKQDG